MSGDYRASGLQRAMLYNDEVTDEKVRECTRCGAIVGDAQLHDKWHSMLGFLVDSVAALSGGGQP